MLQITSKHKIFVAIAAIDFRRGIDSLVALCQQQLHLDPLTGHVFLFRNKKATAIKMLMYDSQGFWLCHKRLSTGRFKHWPSTVHLVENFSVTQLHVLLYNGDPATVKTAPPWRPI